LDGVVREIDIAGRKIGPGHPCFIIAEAGVNHNGSLETALHMVDVAATAGADAVKFQTFRAERLVTADAPKANYQTRVSGAEESQYEMLRRLELPPFAYRELMRRCQEKNILFLSSPFDEQSADFLDGLNVPAFKVASGEITNLPFLTHLARKGKPLVVSTGMSYLSEVEQAVLTIGAAGDAKIILLHCVSNYPANPTDANLRAMATLFTAFGVPVGYSDHVLGLEVALAAVALGACVIEKHFTLDRSLRGPDHQASLTPEELARLIEGVRIVEAALGNGRKEPVPSEINIMAVARKSLVASQDILAGTVLTEDLITTRRPGTGLPPALRPYLVGRTARVHIPSGSLLALEMLA
jgi:N,N'-diacetyllegionaminate synthase